MNNVSFLDMQMCYVLPFLYIVLLSEQSHRNAISDDIGFLALEWVKHEHLPPNTKLDVDIQVTSVRLYE